MTDRAIDSSVHSASGKSPEAAGGVWRRALVDLVEAVYVERRDDVDVVPWTQHKEDCRRPRGDQCCSCGLNQRRFNHDCWLDECAGYQGRAAMDVARSLIAAPGAPADARSDKPEGGGIRGAGSAQPDPLRDAALALVADWDAGVIDPECHIRAIRAALAAITPTDPLDAPDPKLAAFDTFADGWRFDSNGGGVYHVNSTERSVSSPEAAIQDRADAERYRWLSVHGYVEVYCDSPREADWDRSHLDEAVDAAMKAQP